ncbi:MAG TPA: hypothetical protein RMH85_12220 [Polyangiaceae bacterium LLY-WYZ-15_(1-7)]|nr:hypothetical protein [Sandaracinus sp.]HJL04496.1 hypothetical protein [Polyangiaceae bacterium LLY-WYZ-15_(1-7)]MBJ73674.1 hypothetical protein [Sandaracinus sp.]HJL09261.1 hypothetical protein [Polyangiaceae bacterium LLY-WYZ-15_(1-7)]HJL22769.1 hypothetical protein [Polyangiaceae bacterium LLY-WYZ-15_(1-7)]
MRVVFQELPEPCVVEVDGEPREIWPVLVEHALGGQAVPFRFAWDRHHRLLRVDARWEARARLGDREAAALAGRLAREVLKRAAERASE